MALDSFVYIACFYFVIDILIKFGNGNYSNIFGIGEIMVVVMVTHGMEEATMQDLNPVQAGAMAELIMQKIMVLHFLYKLGKQFQQT